MVEEEESEQKVGKVTFQQVREVAPCRYRFLENFSGLGRDFVAAEIYDELVDEVKRFLELLRMPPNWGMAKKKRQAEIRLRKKVGLDK